MKKQLRPTLSILEEESSEDDLNTNSQRSTKKHIEIEKTDNIKNEANKSGRRSTSIVKPTLGNKLKEKLNKKNSTDNITSSVTKKSSFNTLNDFFPNNTSNFQTEKMKKNSNSLNNLNSNNSLNPNIDSYRSTKNSNNYDRNSSPIYNNNTSNDVGGKSIFTPNTLNFSKISSYDMKNSTEDTIYTPKLNGFNNKEVSISNIKDNNAYDLFNNNQYDTNNLSVKNQISNNSIINNNLSRKQTNIQKQPHLHTCTLWIDFCDKTILSKNPNFFCHLLTDPNNITSFIDCNQMLTSPGILPIFLIKLIYIHDMQIINTNEFCNILNHLQEKKDYLQTSDTLCFSIYFNTKLFDLLEKINIIKHRDIIPFLKDFLEKTYQFKQLLQNLVIKANLDSLKLTKIEAIYAKKILIVLYYYLKLELKFKLIEIPDFKLSDLLFIKNFSLKSFIKQRYEYFSLRNKENHFCNDLIKCEFFSNVNYLIRIILSNLSNIANEDSFLIYLIIFKFFYFVLKLETSKHVVKSIFKTYLYIMEEKNLSCFNFKNNEEHIKIYHYALKVVYLFFALNSKTYYEVFYDPNKVINAALNNINNSNVNGMNNHGEYNNKDILRDHSEYSNFNGIMKSLVKIMYYLGRDSDNYLKNYLLLFYREDNINIINKINNKKIFLNNSKQHEILIPPSNLVNNVYNQNNSINPVINLNNIEEILEKYINGNNADYLETVVIYRINIKITENLKHLLYFLTFENSLLFSDSEIYDLRKDIISKINFNDHIFSKQNFSFFKKIFKCEKENDKCRDLAEIDVKNYQVYFTHSSFSFLSNFKIKKNFKEYLKEIYIPDQESLNLPEFPKQDILINYCFIWLDHLMQNNVDKKNFYKEIIFAYIKYSIYDDFNYCYYLLSPTMIDFYKRVFFFIPYDIIDLINFIICYLTQSDDKYEFRKMNRMINMKHIIEFLEMMLFSENLMNTKNLYIYPENEETNNLMFVEGKLNTRRYYPLVLHIHFHFIKFFSFFNANELTESLFSILIEFKKIIYKPVKSNLTPEDILNIESELTLKDVYNKFIGKKTLENSEKDSSLYKFSVKTHYLKCLNNVLENYKGCLAVDKVNKLYALITEIFDLQLRNKKLKSFEKSPRKMVYLIQVLHLYQNLYLFLPLTSQNIIHNFNYQEFQKFSINNESYINIFNSIKSNFELIKCDPQYFNDFYKKLNSYFKILKILITFEIDKVKTNYQDAENVFHKIFEIQYSIFHFIIPTNKSLAKLFEIIDYLLKDCADTYSIKMILGKYYNIMSKYMEYIYLFFDKIYNNKPMLTTFNNFEYFKLNENFIKQIYFCFEKFSYETINIFEMSEIKNSLDKFLEMFSPLVKEQYYLLTSQEEEEKKNIKHFNFLGAYALTVKKKIFGIETKINDEKTNVYNYAYTKESNFEDNTDQLKPNLFLSEFIAELDSYGTDCTCFLNILHITLFYYSNIRSIENIIYENLTFKKSFTNNNIYPSLSNNLINGIPNTNIDNLYELNDANNKFGYINNENQVQLNSRYYYSFLQYLKIASDENNYNSSINSNSTINKNTNYQNELQFNNLYLPLDFYLVLRKFAFNYNLDIYSVILNSILKFNINKKPFQLMSEKFVIKSSEIYLLNTKINPLFCFSNLNMILLTSSLINTNNIMQNINNPFYNFHEITDNIIISLKIIQYTCEYQNQFFKNLLYKILYTVRHKQSDDVVLISLSDIFISNLHLLGKFYLLMYDFIFDDSNIGGINENRGNTNKNIGSNTNYDKTMASNPQSNKEIKKININYSFNDLTSTNNSPELNYKNNSNNYNNFSLNPHSLNTFTSPYTSDTEYAEKQNLKNFKNQNNMHSLHLVKVSPLVIKLYQSYFDTLIEVIQGSKSNIIDSFCSNKEEPFNFSLENEVFINYIGNYSVIPEHKSSNTENLINEVTKKNYKIENNEDISNYDITNNMNKFITNNNMDALNKINEMNNYATADLLNKSNNNNINLRRKSDWVTNRINIQSKNELKSNETHEGNIANFSQNSIYIGDTNKSLSAGFKFFNNTSSLEIFKGFLSSLKEIIFKSKHQRFSLAEIKNIEYKYLKKYMFLFLNSILEQNFKHKSIIKLLHQYLTPEDIQNEVFNRIIELIQNYYESKVKNGFEYNKEVANIKDDLIYGMFNHKKDYKNNNHSGNYNQINSVTFIELLKRLEMGDDIICLLEEQQEKKNTPFITKLFRSRNSNNNKDIGLNSPLIKISDNSVTTTNSINNRLFSNIFKKKKQSIGFSEEQKKIFKDFLDDYFEVLRLMFLYTKLSNQLYNFPLNLEVKVVYASKNNLKMILKILMLQKPIELVKAIIKAIRYLLFRIFLIDYLKSILKKPNEQNVVKNYKFDLSYWEGYINFYFLHKYISVELNNFNKSSEDDSETISVYFELPNDLEYISDSTKQGILDNIDRETPLTKINSFLSEDNFNLVQSEIDFFKSIKKEKYEIYKFINDIKVWYFDVFNFLISLFINILLLLNLKSIEIKDVRNAYQTDVESNNYKNKDDCNNINEKYTFDCYNPNDDLNESNTKINYNNSGIFNNSGTLYNNNIYVRYSLEDSYSNDITNLNSLNASMNTNVSINASNILKYTSLFQSTYCFIYIILWIYYKFLLKIKLNNKISEDINKTKNSNFLNINSSINYSNYSNNPDYNASHSDSHHKQQATTHSFKQKYLNNLIFHEELRDFILILFLGLIALSNEKFYFLYGFQLISILNLSTTLKSIISAINSKMKQLALTVMFLIIVVYCFSIVGFFFLPKEFDEDGEDGESINFCETFFSCFIFIMDYGIRNGGGIGDVLNKKSFNEDSSLFWGRFTYDILFWLIVILIMLNIVMGIVIDTFGELREKLSREDEDKKNTCMICGNKKDSFDKFNKDFDVHLKSEHNPWNYFFYIVYIKNKDTSKRNSHENYVWNCFINEDYSWIPNTEIDSN